MLPSVQHDQSVLLVHARVCKRDKGWTREGVGDRLPAAATVPLPSCLSVFRIAIKRPEVYLEQSNETFFPLGLGHSFWRLAACFTCNIRGVDRQERQPCVLVFWTEFVLLGTLNDASSCFLSAASGISSHLLCDATSLAL